MIGGSRRAGIPRIFASPKIDVGGVRSEGGLVEIARELTISLKDDMNGLK